MKVKSILIATLFSSAFLPSIAQQTITSFTHQVIQYGNSCTINSKKQTEPDVYMKSNGNGTFTAQRLTVQPNGNRAITQPYLFLKTPTSIHIAWKTSSKPSKAVVSFGLSADQLDKTTTAITKTISDSYFWNQAVLTDLQPNTTYYYRVTTGATDGKVYSFRTLMEEGSNETLRVLVIGDHQQHKQSDFEWLVKAAHRKANEKWGEKNLEQHFDFLLNDGDQVDGGALENYDQCHLYKSRFHSPYLPTQTTLGNHETYGDPGLSNWKGHYADYATWEYNGISSGSTTYYAYRAGRTLFVIMDTEHPGDIQRFWLRRLVNAADQDPDIDFIVSAEHRPPYAEQYSDDISPWVRDVAIPLLSTSKKHVLNIAGHHHLYARGQMTDLPTYHIITGGGTGGHPQLWGESPNNVDWDEVQKTIDHWTFQILEFNPTSKEMTVESYSIGNSRHALDCQLIDKFSRNLATEERPATPTLQQPGDTLELPAVLAQAEPLENMQASEFQIARDSLFKDVVVRRVQTYEDLYDIDYKTFAMIDRHKDLDLSKFTVEGLENGTYYVRTRNRNMNLDWSEYSNTCTFSVTGQKEAEEPEPDPNQPSVSFDKTTYQPGETITISYNNAPVGQSAWIGIYIEGQTSGASYTWKYTSTASGTMTFQINEQNNYIVRLYQDGGYTIIAEAGPFKVKEEQAPFELTTVLKTDKLVYEVGDPIKVTVENAPANSSDWVGIYLARDSISESAISKNWVYVTAGKANQIITLNVEGTRNYSQPLPAGNYYVSYYLNNGYTESSPRVYFRIGKPSLIATGKKFYEDGETVQVIFDNVPKTGNFVISLRNDQQELKRLPLEKVTGGVVSLGTWPKGHYQVAIVDADDNSEMSEAYAFSIAIPESVGSVTTSNDRIYYQNGKIRIDSNDALQSVRIFNTAGQLLADQRVQPNSRHLALPVAKGEKIVFVSINGRQAQKVFTE